MHDEIIRQEDQDSTPPIRLGGLNYAWIVAATGSIAMFCGLGLGRFAFGMLLPSMSASLGLNYTQSGILGFTNLIGYLVAVLLSPLIIPRFGTRATATASLLLIAVSMLGMAFTTSFPLLCALYVLTGIGSGGVVLPMMSVMSHWFFPSHRGLALGLVMAGPGFGIILSGFVVPKLLPTSGLLSWQMGWLSGLERACHYGGLCWRLFRACSGGKCTCGADFCLFRRTGSWASGSRLSRRNHGRL